MKKIIAMLMAACVAMTLLAGCGAAASSESKAQSGAVSSADKTQSGAADALSGVISTGGSSSVEKVWNIFKEIYAEKQPGVAVKYDLTGSGAGITGAAEGTLDIGLSSRALKEDELNELEGVTFALDGIAIIVNPENPVKDLSLEQIAGIAKGEITNWSEVGGNDEEIVLIGRESGSGTRDGFESIVGVKDECKYGEEQSSTGGVIGSVAANTGAVGYASLSGVNATVKAVTVEGIEASEATVLDGSYKIQRPFVAVLKKGAARSAAVEDFLAFIQSEEAAEYVRQGGAVPVV